ncbi:prolyl oligopeptidase family protein [Lentisphaera araneosa HTCC2155]|uniref:Prolyl oligopeptidase family protein n=1 Tax=Lentisphaera araneosa HTCC2155 TaxID=313628 RepID=A6DQY7_9BACT|nr:prolyl oligopeptidase family serine peptidase [Lentisphaera araneosa]EDM26037.1 prolyl oligopeptidase family protein [Lentisphaera araneosa HTCC2155]
MTLPVNFPLDAYSQIPEIIPASEYSRPGVEALYFTNEPYKGKETRVFSYMGMPYLKEGQNCPAMVLIHGGGGTAFEQWVRLWNQRGYAAIAIDTCGSRPDPTAHHSSPHLRDEFSGPEGWHNSFHQMSDPLEDQWQYHAVTALLRAHTLLATQPGVDPKRIGVSGISWGGYLTSLIMGIDFRYSAAIQVYGCGFITDNSTWKDQKYEGASEAEMLLWRKQWDPMHYLPNSNMPTLWVTGTNDFAYPLDSFQKSYNSVPGTTDLVLIHEMEHGHEAGWAPEEIQTFTDSLFRDCTPLAQVISYKVQNWVIKASFESARPLIRAEILFTRATGMWQDRKFNVMEAEINNNTVSVEIPDMTTVVFLNVYDDRGLVCSSPHIELS